MLAWAIGWQEVAVLVVVLGVFLLLPAWVFGGGALLLVGGRFLARSPKAKYGFCVGANVVSVLAGAAVSGAIVGVAVAVFGLASPATWAATAVALLAGLAVTWWVIRALLAVPFAKAVLAWLPTAWQVLLSPAVVLAIATPSATKAVGITDQSACARQLSKIGQAVATCVASRATMGGRREPITLADALKQLPPDFPRRCPAAKRQDRLAGRKQDYFVYASAWSNEKRQVIGCDLRGNHGDGTRTVLYADGCVHKRSEADFQAELAQPTNADFAKALRQAEGP